MAIEAHRLSHSGVVGYASRRRVATVAAIVRGNGGAGVGSECRRKPARPRGLQYRLAPGLLRCLDEFACHVFEGVFPA